MKTLLDRINRIDGACDGFVASLTTRGLLETAQERWRTSWLKGIGGLPGDPDDASKRTPLRAKEGPVVECGGFTLQNVLFESMDGVYVVGHLALPSGSGVKAPYRAVLMPMGHSDNGILNPRYAEHLAMMARAGFAAFTWDPIGQGERFQAPDGRASVTDCAQEHTSIGARAWLTGWNFARFRIWDSIRAVDYLETRRDIDVSRLAVCGTSGGGTESAYLQALDKRIKVAFPNCYISSFREVFACRGCHDSEQFYFNQLNDGVNHAAMLAMGLSRVALAIGSTYDDYFPQRGSASTFAVYSALRSRLGIKTPHWHFHTTGRHGLPPPTRQAQVDWMRHAVLGEKAPGDLCSYHMLDDFGMKKDPVNSSPLPFPAKASFFTGGAGVRTLPGFRSIYDIVADRVRALAVAREKRGLPDVEALRATVRRRAAIRPLEDIPDEIAEPFDHPHFNWWYLKGAYGFRRENEAAMMSTLGQSVVGRDAENILVKARREMRARGGAKTPLEAKGPDVIAAAHAFAAEPQLFSSLRFTDPPPSWSKTALDPKPARESYALAVWGALEEYDWTDLVPARALTGAEVKI